MGEHLDAVSAADWHPQDVILVAQALHRFAESGDLSEERTIRAYAVLFGLIDSSGISFEHTEFSDYDHLSNLSDVALFEWMDNQADDTWGEELS